MKKTRPPGPADLTMESSDDGDAALDGLVPSFLPTALGAIHRSAENAG
jgi:hypothetical protein